MKLGIALAKLKTMREEDVQNFNTEEGKWFRHLYELKESMRQDPDAVRSFLMNGIPDSRCNPESRLVGNEEFFTSYLLEYNLKAEHEEHCNRLSSHLNDCFQCFQNYSDIVRDFLHNQ